MFGVGGVEFCEHGDCGAGGVFESGDYGEACLLVVSLFLLRNIIKILLKFERRVAKSNHWFREKTSKNKTL